MFNKRYNTLVHTDIVFKELNDFHDMKYRSPFHTCLLQVGTKGHDES